MMENCKPPPLDDIEVRNLLRLHERGATDLGQTPQADDRHTTLPATIPSAVTSAEPCAPQPPLDGGALTRTARPEQATVRPEHALSPPAAPQAAGGVSTDAGRPEVFIGHGHSAAWRELKDFLQDRLHLRVGEFNSTPAAGIATTERLLELLETSKFAFLVLTAEDERGDGRKVARMNVVHEVGLFQGRLGLRRAIVLFEEGCPSFSNIHGLGCISFPKGQIGHKFEEVRRVLEREEIIQPSTSHRPGRIA